MDKVVDYFAYEQSQVRYDRVNRRLWILCIILTIFLFVSNAGWIYYESQFTDTTTTIEAQQGIDNGDGNAIITDGVHINGSDNTTGKDNN